MNDTQTTDLAVIPPAMLPTIIAADTNDILGTIARKVATFKPDISTAKGRGEMRSLAAEIATAKMDLIRIGKGLTEGWRKSTKAVNEECNVIEERMNALRDRVRERLTEWETREKARVAGHEAALADVAVLWVFDEAEPTPEAVADRLAVAERGSNRDWEEFGERATKAYLTAVTMLTAALALANKRDADRIELERLRAEQAERDRQEALRRHAEHEAAIAAKAAADAKAAAEKVAAEEAAAAERKATAERRRLADEADAARQKIIRDAENARLAAEAARLKAAAEAKAAADKAAQEKADAERREQEAQERAEKAERDAKAAKAKAEADALAAAQKAEADRVAAEAKAKRDAEAAVAADRKRAADAKAAEEAETKRRAANVAHRTKVAQEALAAIMLAMSEVHTGTAEEAAAYGKAIIIAVAKGEIPHMTISY